MDKREEIERELTTFFEFILSINDKPYVYDSGYLINFKRLQTSELFKTFIDLHFKDSKSISYREVIYWYSKTYSTLSPNVITDDLFENAKKYLR